MPSLKLTLRVLCAVIVASLVALSIVVAVFFKLYPIRTNSMTPTLPVKSLVFVKEGSYQEGDIITFRHHTLSGGQELVTHRFIKRDGNGLIITKGDGNDSVDAWPVKDQDVTGKVVLCVPQAGFWLMVLKTPDGLGGMLLLALAFWLLVLELRRPRKVETP